MKTRNFLFWSGLLWVLMACGNERDPDPCKDLTPVTADFKIEEWLFILGPYETDTVLTYRPIIITALQDYDSYEWKVGSDPTIRTEKSFNLGFTQAVGKIDIRLIARRSPNLSCFPDDNGIDTLTKSVYVSEWANSPIIGNYEGYVVGRESDRFVVEIQDYGGDCGITIKNIPKGCVGVVGGSSIPDPCNEIGLDGFPGGGAFSFDTGYYGGGGCDNSEGFAKLKKGNKNEIEIEYTRFGRSNPNPPLKEKFIGTRIN
jgi:hypothetical protein